MSCTSPVAGIESSVDSGHSMDTFEKLNSIVNLHHNPEAALLWDPSFPLHRLPCGCHTYRSLGRHRGVLTVLEAGSLNHGVGRAGLSQGLFPWLADGRLLPTSSRGLPSRGVCLPISFSKDTGQITLNRS